MAGNGRVAVLTGAAANSGSVAGLEVGGLRSAIETMGREARWSSTAAVGKRPVATKPAATKPAPKRGRAKTR